MKLYLDGLDVGEVRSLQIASHRADLDSKPIDFTAWSGEIQFTNIEWNFDLSEIFPYSNVRLPVYEFRPSRLLLSLACLVPNV